MGFRAAALQSPDKPAIVMVENCIEALPRHATGKLYKRLLKDQYCS